LLSWRPFGGNGHSATAQISNTLRSSIRSFARSLFPFLLFKFFPNANFPGLNGLAHELARHLTVVINLLIQLPIKTSTISKSSSGLNYFNGKLVELLRLLGQCCM